MIRLSGAAAIAASLVLSSGALAADVDILALFSKAADGQRVGVARKTKPVDGRAAVSGEVVVTVIRGDGVETRSKPAEAGDVVVRNRCPETGNEEYLVKAAKMKDRYGDPLGSPGPDGWAAYAPKGVELRFFRVTEADGTLGFQAPWGEAMVARPGDVIVQDPANPKDTYRIYGPSFACTYEVVRAP